MTQGRFERVLFYFAGEVIAARTKISRAEDRTRRDFAFEVEIILQRVWELRMVSRRANIYRLRQERILRVKKAGEYKGVYAQKRRQKPIETKQNYGELIAKDARSASQHS